MIALFLWNYKDIFCYFENIWYNYARRLKKYTRKDWEDKKMSDVLKGLEPEAVYRYFEEICAIPHGSGNTKKISDYCVRQAERMGLVCEQDVSGNVIIWKEGTGGLEDHAPVMIQGHLDMVCEKTPGNPVDMTTEGLKLELTNGIISAEGTTLGGDDGIAVAYALALLESDEIMHPPLEVVLTVDEEIGMLGAAALDPAHLKAKRMLNLDSEDEGYLLVSCAGGSKVTMSYDVTGEEGKDGYDIEIKVSGGQGGHSGVEIDKGRVNACKLLGRILYQMREEVSYRLVELNGGLKDNAIPREAAAVVWVPSEKEKDLVNRFAEKMDPVIRDEKRRTDPDVRLSGRELGKDSQTGKKVLTEDDSARIVAALHSYPDGISRMSFEIPGLVQTSLNLGIMKTSDQTISFAFAVRSSVDSEKRELTDRLQAVGQMSGARMDITGDYPAWEYREDSPLRDVMVEVFEQLYGKKPVIQALHAGVECGLFAGKIPGLDCVSFGPDMKDIHTTEESMDTRSVARTWEYILEILKRL